MLKNQKGITLVALVITIIVLLLLAGVAITIAVNGQDGLFDNAKNAKTKWNADVTKEETDIENAIEILTYYSNNQ